MVSRRLRVVLTFTVVLSAGEPVGKRPLEPELTDRDRNHWAFVKPTRPAPPRVRDRAWVRSPIDAFILARLEQAALTPAPPADRATLLRRVTFDLTGLPPTPAELDAWLADTSPNAYERLVDRLLASPHYGERWAQHWLDVVRFAESNGYEVDGERPHAWRYRDYVVRSLNADKPYDEFLREQIAGDELAAGREPRTCTELLVATGFHRCGPVHLVSGNVDPEVNRQEVLTEMTAGLGSAVLGLTIGCARCHDHKFDPVSQADYYRLQAFFAAAQPKEVPIAGAEEKAARERLAKELNAKLAPLKKQVGELDRPVRDRLTEAKRAKLEPAYRDALAAAADKRTPAQKKLAEHAQILIRVTWDEVLDAMPAADRQRRAVLREQMHALDAQMPPPAAEAWAVRNEEKTPATHLLIRGDVARKGAKLEPSVPRVLTTQARGLPAAGLKPSRVALADWATRPDHPLTARVLVNRLWQHHFGRGLVATPNDFGVRGERPTHPELLDWLAVEFVESGWSLKHLHRLMVLSSTYRQASRVAADAPCRRLDADNRLLSRMNRRRLEGEALRDSLLAAAGTLNRKVGGPKVFVPLEPEVYDLIFTEGEPDGLWPVTPDQREHTRRTLYLFAKRNVRLPILEAFDQPDTLSSCPQRSVSTFAPQALILLNGPLAQGQSKRFAERLLRECGPDVDRLIDRAYRLALGRTPKDVEVRMGQDFLGGAANSSLSERAADFCLALVNRNEFVYLD
jgi:hypothetical protein